MHNNLFLSNDTRFTAETSIALFGGTFDPPHWGHLIVAEEIRDTLHLDYVVFIPAAIPPHKLGKDISDPEHRLRMLEIAARDYPGFEVSAVELNRKGLSYTIDTIQTFLESVSDVTLVVGADNARELQTWKDYPEILDRARVVMVPRPGFDETELDENIGMRIERVTAPLIDISSTDIRRRAASGRSYRLLTPKVVAQYVTDNGLYLPRDEKEL
jgi:nicotinate-nucleotide adenylyltransferase